MIEKADRNLNEVISVFSEFKIPAAYIVPTPTGLGKSIMDATAPLRSFLKEHGIHDYDSQPQGTENKIMLKAEIIVGGKSIPTEVSVYRPDSKDGDPRIWIYSLKKYAKAFNLIALIVFDGKLRIINASDGVTLNTIKDPQTALGMIARQLSKAISDAAAELLGMLRERTGDKFIMSMREGSTGIGLTLETLLGIDANNNQTPDYKGIEIKASRQNPGALQAANRVNLFSQVPDWKQSPIGNAFNMLKEYGYTPDDRLQLYCTLDAIKPNSQHLMLSVEDELQILKTMYVTGDTKKSLMIWAVSKLKDRLEEKHPESFWVKAETKRINGQEHFRYYKVIHTVKPISSNLDYLLGDGTVTLDLTMSQKDKNKNVVRDHGYLFKIWPKDFHTLFPPSLEHDLCS